MSNKRQYKILSKDKLNDDIYRFSIDAREIAVQAKPGQFLEIKCGNGVEPLLRRPISIYNADKDSGIVEFIIQVRGQATQILSEMLPGQILDILGPLGKGFSIDSSINRAAVVGGGIGIFPLYYAAKSLQNAEINTYLGFRSNELLVLEKEFNEVSDALNIATDDGSYGYKGLVTDILERDIKQKKFDIIYACGPKPMLQKLSEVAHQNNINCEISIEERMGCGVGACLGCACKLKDEEEWHYGHVCKDGPVFNIKDIVLD